MAVGSIELFIDGKTRPLSTPLSSGADVQYRWKPVTLKNIVQDDNQEPLDITVKVNGHKVKLTREKQLPLVNGQPTSFDYVVKENDQIYYKPYATGELSSYIVTDIFRDYEPEEDFSQRGGTIYVNGQKAGFTSPIKHGDIVEFVPYGADMANS